jgi:putative acetyltransferase
LTLLGARQFDVKPHYPAFVNVRDEAQDMTDSDFHIRGETDDDLPAIRQLNINAFKQNNEADLIDRLRRENRFTHDMSIVAQHPEGQIIGHVLLSEIECHTDAGRVKTGAIAPGAIDLRYRSLKLAKALMDGLLHQARRYQFDLLLMVARPKVYRRVGFSAELAQKIQSPYSSAGSAFMALELRHGCIRNAAFAKAAYPRAFAKCDNIIAERQDVPPSGFYDTAPKPR